GYEPAAVIPTVSELERSYTGAAAKALKICSNGKIGDRACAKRLIYLVLRNAIVVDDSMIRHTAKLTGHDVTRLLGYATELRQLMGKRKERKDALVLKRNNFHFKIHRLRSAIASEEDTGRLHRYEAELSMAQQKYKRLTRDIKQTVLVPTHKDIGMVMGVPKGSIDSGLHYLKEAFRDAELN
ncbi:MAG: hypothetical protein HN368_19090, partial [Spirochaetales bacterium]|nr:hypothetical protein [Spirochaetales bacterium]